MFTKLRYLYRAYRYRFRVDPAELRFVCSCLTPGQVAVDVGCHKGAYTYWMRRQVWPAGAVYAFEPQPRQVAYLREIFTAMQYDNVVLVPAALSDAPGHMSLYIPTGDGQTHLATLEPGAWSREQGAVVRGSPDPAQAVTEGIHTSVDGKEGRPAVAEVARSGDRPQQIARDRPQQEALTVEVTTLDAVFVDQPLGPNFLKIDVEGHELAVLAGARQTLETNRPTILVECEARHRPDGDVRPVFEFLTSLGYQGSFFCNGQRRPLIEFDPALHQPPVSSDGQPPRGYVNNFAFECPSGKR